MGETFQPGGGDASAQGRRERSAGSRAGAARGGGVPPGATGGDMHLQSFRGPGHVLGFDRHRPLPSAPVDTRLVAALRASGMDPAYIYGYQLVGLIPLDSGSHGLSEEVRSTFWCAVAQYRRLEG